MTRICLISSQHTHTHTMLFKQHTGNEIFVGSDSCTWRLRWLYYNTPKWNESKTVSTMDDVDPIDTLCSRRQASYDHDLSLDTNSSTPWLTRQVTCLLTNHEYQAMIHRRPWTSLVYVFDTLATDKLWTSKDDTEDAYQRLKNSAKLNFIVTYLQCREPNC